MAPGERDTQKCCSLKTGSFCPGRVARLDGASSCALKVCGFDSWSVPKPWF